MPELPEVETIRRQLAPELRERRILSLEILDRRWSALGSPELLSAAVAGQRIVTLGRRGKYLLLELASASTLVMHLRMTGNLLLVSQQGPNGSEPAGPDPSGGRHLRARLVLDDARELRFVDPRRFGEGYLLGTEALATRLAERLGIEPLSSALTAERLGAISATRFGPLKSFLLDQRAVAGIGNIYADEALFRAGLHPLSPAASMRAQHLAALRAGIVAALVVGLKHGGASIDDYRDARGARGVMQDEFLVHRREGAPCVACARPIRRILVAGRSTYFCPFCQARLRRRRGR